MPARAVKATGLHVRFERACALELELPERLELRRVAAGGEIERSHRFLVSPARNLRVDPAKELLEIDPLIARVVGRKQSGAPIVAVDR